MANMKNWARGRAETKAEAAKAIAPGTRGMASRVSNAEEKFIDFAMSKAGLSRAEALKALATYKKVKAIKIDAVGGQYTLTHGAFGDAEPLQRAAGRDV